MTTPILPRASEGMCHWCDDVNGRACPKCDTCGKHARWSVCDLRDDDEPIVAALLCGAHLSSGMSDLDWTLDVVHVYDLAQGVGS